MATKKREIVRREVETTDDDGNVSVEERAEFVTITHTDDDGGDVSVTLTNDNRVNEYKRSLRENGKHFTCE